MEYPLQLGWTVVLWFPLKVASIFLDLVCSIYVVTNKTEVNYSFMSSSKSGFQISGPSMFSTNSNHYDWGKLYHISGPRISVYVVIIRTGVTHSFIISSKSGLHISVPNMFCICSNQYKCVKLFFYDFL